MKLCVEGVYVKAAVRASGDGMLFARTLYVLNRNRVEDFIARGTLRGY